jgi:hypothetical protein
LQRQIIREKITVKMGDWRNSKQKTPPVKNQRAAFAP